MKVLPEHPGFELFWQEWPKWRRAAKKNAQKAWNKEKPDLEVVRATLKWQGALWAGRDREFTPHPATWINRRGFEDEQPPPPVPAAPRIQSLEDNKEARRMIRQMCGEEEGEPDEIEI